MQVQRTSAVQRPGGVLHNGGAAWLVVATLVRRDCAVVAYLFVLLYIVIILRCIKIVVNKVTTLTV